MKELTREEFQKTFAEPMKRFGLSDEWKKRIEAIGIDLLQRKSIKFSEVNLDYCYENGTGTFVHYIVGFGDETRYIIIISDEGTQEWYGFYFFDESVEYGWKDRRIELRKML